jgi:hypothetical protein
VPLNITADLASKKAVPLSIAERLKVLTSRGAISFSSATDLAVLLSLVI